MTYKSNSKLYLILNFFLLLFAVTIPKTEADNLSNSEQAKLEVDYLQSRNELEDYIIDTGDSVSLEFNGTDELNGIFEVNPEGEVYLPRLYETYVRGLTISELKTLLEQRYAEFLIDPKIKVKIVVFKGIRILLKGELRNPGFYKFPAYQPSLYQTFDKDVAYLGSSSEQSNEGFEIAKDFESINQSSENIIVKRSNEKITTISDAILKAGGITSSTDLSRIEIIRDVPIAKGGGKKRAFINFNSYINKSDLTKDIRLFDGDTLFFPKLDKNNKEQIPQSILSGISPKFISVSIFGRVDNPGPVLVPLEATLSDLIDLTGPIKPLSGKVVLIRYEKNGEVYKQNISYSARASRGSKGNPFLKEGDLISVKDSFLGKTTGIIQEVSLPFIGIYTARDLFFD